MPEFILKDRQREALKLLGGPQRHTLLVGGARSSKTTLFVRNTILRSLMAPKSRHVILRFRTNAVKRSIALDTFPRTAEMCFPGVKFEFNKGMLYFTGPNESEIWMSGLDEKDRVEQILGLEFATEFFNECSQIPWSSVLTARTRLAQKVVIDYVRVDEKTGKRIPLRHGHILPQRFYYDLNPVGKGHYTYRMFIDHVDPDTGRKQPNPDEYKHMFLSPYDNSHNLTPETIQELESLPERMRRRYLEGVYSAEVEGALWTDETLEKSRMERGDALPPMKRIVIAVDPSGTSGDEEERSDEIGIVAGGIGNDGKGYLFEDASCNLPPAGWAREVIRLYTKYHADCVVAEVNFGGEMVRHVIRGAASAAGLPSIRIKKLTASRGKVVRAEPISQLYEDDKVRHIGEFPKLEDQMLNMSTAGYQGMRSPDRLDALVWLWTELLDKQRPPWLQQALVPQRRHSGIIPIYAR